MLVKKKFVCAHVVTSPMVWYGLSTEVHEVEVKIRCNLLQLSHTHKKVHQNGRNKAKASGTTAWQPNPAAEP